MSRAAIETTKLTVCTVVGVAIGWLLYYRVPWGWVRGVVPYLPHWPLIRHVGILAGLALAFYAALRWLGTRADGAHPKQARFCRAVVRRTWPLAALAILLVAIHGYLRDHVVTTGGQAVIVGMIVVTAATAALVMLARVHDWTVLTLGQLSQYLGELLIFGALLAGYERWRHRTTRDDLDWIYAAFIVGTVCVSGSLVAGSVASCRAWWCARKAGEP